MKKSILLFLLILAQPAFAVHINEVMYNPPGNDNNKEFVEVYAEIDINGWSIGDLKSNDTLVKVKNSTNYFLLIVEDGYDYSNIDAIIYVVGSTIGNNLGNSGDYVKLYNPDNELVDWMSYTSYYANGNNKTLEFNGTEWEESVADGGTPGRNNSVLQEEVLINDTVINETNSSEIDETNQTNITNTTEINETNSTIDEVIDNGCDLSLNITTTKFLYEKEKIGFWNNVNNKSVDFKIEYWIEDYYGNIVKKAYNTTNTNKKSYTPSADGVNVFFIKSRFTSIGCNDSNASNNNATVMVVFAGEDNGADDEETKTTTSTEKDSEEKKSISYDVSLPEIVFNVEEFSINLTIENENKEHSFEVYSYVYRGSKCYSGKREENKQNIVLKAGEKKDIVLRNVVEAEEGEYKVKVKIKKDELKTMHEITKEIFVEKKEEIVEDTGAEKIIKEEKKEENKTMNKITGGAVTEVVFESKNSFIKKIIKYFVAGVVGLGSIFAIYRKYI